MGVSNTIHVCQWSNKQGIYMIIYQHTKHAINNEYESM